MTDRALMEERAAHRHGRRYARVGDVFVDPSAPAKGEAVVIKVEGPTQRGSHASTRAGKAWLLWTNRQGKQRRTVRKCDSLRALDLIRVLDPVARTPAAQHAHGIRAPRIGDKLRCRSSKREALVTSLTEAKAQLGWLDTGRSSWRASASLRWLELVREGAELARRFRDSPITRA